MDLYLTIHVAAQAHNVTLHDIQQTEGRELFSKALYIEYSPACLAFERELQLDTEGLIEMVFKVRA